MHNSLTKNSDIPAPYEILKNRRQIELDPVRFESTPLDSRVANEKFSKKVDKVLKSRLGD